MTQKLGGKKAERNNKKGTHKITLKQRNKKVVS